MLCGLNFQYMKEWIQIYDGIVDCIYYMENYKRIPATSSDIMICKQLFNNIQNIKQDVI